MKDLVQRLRVFSEQFVGKEAAAAKQAADLLERIYSQPVELPEAVAYQSSLEWRLNHLMSRRQYDSCLPKNRVDFDVPLYTADQLTQAVQEATARALEAAANEADRWQSAIHDPRYECDCATAIRNLIGRVK